MSKTVFIVTLGEYSDYRIKAVFTERAVAEEYATTLKGEYYQDAEIEAWDLDVPRERHWTDRTDDPDYGLSDD